MSVENLKEYARRCATEPDLLAAAKTIGMTDVEEHMRQAGDLGLDWTRDDLVAFRRELTGDESDDLTDLTEEELEQIAGGVATATLAVAVGVGAGVGLAATAAVVGAGVGGATAGGKGGW